MPSIRSWTDEELKTAVKQNSSYRSVLIDIGLVPAGGNYDQVKRRIRELNLETNHFTGKLWNKGKTYHTNTRPIIESILVNGVETQSYKLKKRLFEEGIKNPLCEICGWAEVAKDGRIPVELDHINGIKQDNRLENLRILCPNCHSLQPTHRGKNKKNRYARVVE